MPSTSGQVLVWLLVEHVLGVPYALFEFGGYFDCMYASAGNFVHSHMGSIGELYDPKEKCEYAV